MVLYIRPSLQSQMNQCQSSISCTWSRTRTSLVLSAIEKHRRSEALFVFMGFMLQKRKEKKYNTNGVLETLIPGILRGWAIYIRLLHFLNPTKTEQNVPMHSTPIPKKVSILSLSYNLYLLKQKVNVILRFSKVFLDKTS